MIDPRLKTYLKLAAERSHPFYARQALRFAYAAGDEEAMHQAIALGALSYQPESPIKMQSEEESTIQKRKASESHAQNANRPMLAEIVQLRLFDEAA